MQYLETIQVILSDVSKRLYYKLVGNEWRFATIALCAVCVKVKDYVPPTQKFLFNLKKGPPPVPLISGASV